MSKIVRTDTGFEMNHIRSGRNASQYTMHNGLWVCYCGNGDYADGKSKPTLVTEEVAKAWVDTGVFLQ